MCLIERMRRPTSDDWKRWRTDAAALLYIAFYFVGGGLLTMLIQGAVTRFWP